jgi:predicted transcriptional regulator
MARPKKPKASAKPQPKAIAFRVSDDYAAWVEKLAAHNRTTVSGMLDQALVRFAKEIGFTDPAPER